MEATVQTGYLVIADISGYTLFMAEAELEHAQKITSELLNCIVAHLTPVLTLAEIEGDAVFTYVPEAKLPRGETLLELIEATYVAFRDRLGSMQRQTPCACRACRAATRLNLKFVTHLGQYIVQTVAGRKKPVGSDVNLVHRLLKNTVADATGWHAYALFTKLALDHMRVQPTEMHEDMESHKHLGEITTFSLNLQKRYDVLVEERRVLLTEEETHFTLTRDFAAPRPVVWEWLHAPEKRNLWLAGTQWSLGVRSQGRSGPGAESLCVHGKGVATEQILDWRPFDYFTYEVTGGPITFRAMNRLIPITDGTRLQGYYKLNLPLPRWMARPLGRLFFTKRVKIEAGWETLARFIADSSLGGGVGEGTTGWGIRQALPLLR